MSERLLLWWLVALLALICDYGDMSLVLVVIVSVFVTSAISGVLGMIGGMILMAVYAAVFPVELAMIFHGFTQFLANGQRVVLWRKHLFSQILVTYFLGALIALVLFKIFVFVPDKALIFLCLGLFPFLTLFKKSMKHLDVLKPWVSAICGLLVTAAQLVSGASGPVLDIFYVRSSLNRHEVIANKAMTQTLGHALKLAYYLLLILSVENVEKWQQLQDMLWLLPMMAGASFAGTMAGTRILDRIDEKQFRTTSQWLVLMIGVYFLYRAFMLWFSGFE